MGPAVYHTLFQVNAVAPLSLTHALLVNGNLAAGSKVGFISSIMGSLGATESWTSTNSMEYRCVCVLCVL